MMGVRTWGIIDAIIGFIVKLIFKIIGFFHLTPLFFVGIIGLILYLTGALNNHTVLIIFDIAVALAVGYAIIAFVVGIIKPKKKKKEDKKEKRGKVDIVDTPPAKAETNEKPEQTEQVVITPTDNYGNSSAQVNIPQAKEREIPQFFEVRQNPAYVMAEYSDRYELFRKTPQGLVKIRTDYK